MLIDIMTYCDVTADETLMIGDSVSDIEMAKQVGVDAIGMDFGYQAEEMLIHAGAQAVFDDYDKLAQYLGL